MMYELHNLTLDEIKRTLHSKYLKKKVFESTSEGFNKILIPSIMEIDLDRNHEQSQERINAFTIPMRGILTKFFLGCKIERKKVVTSNAIIA